MRDRFLRCANVCRNSLMILHSMEVGILIVFFFFFGGGDTRWSESMLYYCMVIVRNISSVENFTFI